MTSENRGVARRGLLMRGAGVGGGIALAAVGLGASAQSTPTSNRDLLEKARADVADAYDTTKKDLDDFGSNVSDSTKSSYDDIKKRFDALGAKLDEAKKLPADSVHDVRRSYRDIQHELENLDLKIDDILSSSDKDAHTGWSDVRTKMHGVHQKLDHVFDAL